MHLVIFQGMQERNEESGAGCPYRVAQGAGAAVDVEPVRWEAELLCGNHRDDRKCLVDLQQVDIVD